MAQLFASEVAMDIALNGIRIHGGTAMRQSSTRGAISAVLHFMIVGQSTNDIGGNGVAQRLVARNER
jgi:hypothetical protein